MNADRPGDFPRRLKLIEKLSSAMLGALSLQFLLGIIANLYVKFPETKDQNQLWHAAWVNWSTATHMVLGLIIVALAITLLVHGVGLKKQPLTKLTILGFVFVLIAAIGGEEFVRTQNEAFSLTMAIGFIVAIGLYGRLLAVTLVEKTKFGQVTKQS